MKELNIEAKTDNLATVLAFIDEQLEKYNCPLRQKVHLDVAVEELYVNIARYAYNPEVGWVKLRISVDDNPLAVSITFMDNGKPYDPLAKKDPDITLSADERDIGGLGIYMVKQNMEDVRYEYKNGMNILTIKKNI
ncbi:MAG: ATP-binding protein [Lachnospiraceae bacterium]|nr:ATP-binding protein [Lachnospiraceae bacterium]